ncbi:response regulator [Gulosibacter sediminis]|uniref:response regulator n=1 Tax=Gulosibacter sediminis TaxID=1729695 RepID=UPI0024A823DA|nr:response regulator transcription factor [Gulosibacter sediminis]
MSATSVVVVEPHLLVRAGFSLILDAPADIDVVGQGETVDDLMRLANEQRPDVVCVAAKFADGSTVMDALEALTRVESYRPVVLLLTGKHDADIVDVATSRGVAAAISKFATPEDIVDAVRTAAQGTVTRLP